MSEQPGRRRPRRFLENKPVRLSEAAKLIGRSVSSLRRAIVNGYLLAHKVGGIWMVWLYDLEDWFDGDGETVPRKPPPQPPRRRPQTRDWQIDICDALDDGGEGWRSF